MMAWQFKDEHSRAAEYTEMAGRPMPLTDIEYHGTSLAGDRLVEGRYEPVATLEPEDGVLQGYSEVLGLYVRWKHGQLEWRDPATGQPIASLEAAEQRIQELQEELCGLRGD